MTKIISIFLFVCGGLQPLYADELSDTIAGYQHGCNKGYPTSCNRLGLLYLQQGKYNEAEPFFLRSLTIREESLGKDHIDVTKTLGNLAELYRIQGKYGEVELLLRRRLAIQEKSSEKDSFSVAITLDHLASLYIDQGRYNEAEPFLLRSLAIQKEGIKEDDEYIGIGLNNLAFLYNTQGRYNKAEALYQRSIAVLERTLGKNDTNVGAALDNLAQTYQAQGRYNKAEPFLLRSLAITEKALGKNHPEVASTLNILAMHYLDQKKYNKVEPLLQRSLSIQEKALGKDHPAVAAGLNNLASLYLDQEKYNKIEPLLQRSLAIREKASLGKDHPAVAASLDNLAWFYLSQGNYSQAESSLQRSLHIKNQLLDYWLWGAGEKTRQAYLKEEENARNVYLSFYSLQNTPEEAFYFSLSRKGLLLRIASEMNTLSKQSTNFEIQKQVQEFNALKTQVATLTFSGKPEDKAKIQELEEQSNTLEMQLSQSVSGFKSGKTEVTSKEVLEKLESDQALIDFLLYTDIDFKNRLKTQQVIALVINKENGIKLIKLGEFAPIAAAIKTYQSAIVPTEENANNREKTITQTAQTLYEKLWQPLTPYLQNKKTVYLIPDGDLHLLPFKALQDTDGKYLAEKWQLITLSSARDIVLPPLTGKASAAAIFAAPDYGDDTAIIKAGNTAGATELKNIHFDPLPNALNEGQQIDKLFIKKQPEPAAKLFLKAQATEQAINALTAPKILHLSTHGFFLEDNKPDEKALEHGRGLMRGLDESLPIGKIENPLTRSGLAFANANFGVKGIKQSDGTNGILTALEVLNLDLAGTDLVTLSACDTGKGDVNIGEGVYSLNRAFQEAGAKTVLSTLWSVADESTGIFMQRFYEHFLNGEPAQQAIQATQNEFMHDAKYKQYSNPYYWAGFVMMGKE